MSQDNLPDALARFVDATSEILQQDADEAIFLPRISEAMQSLVAEDDWLAPSLAKPHPDFYQQYLLYCDPAERFSVVSFVWGPGQTTPVHDHTVWGVIGVLRGAELCENYSPTPVGAPMQGEGEQRLEAGQVACVSPHLGDVHRVSNAFDDRVSISIHAYGANIGKVSRHVFDEMDGAPKTFISGYANKAS